MQKEKFRSVSAPFFILFVWENAPELNKAQKSSHTRFGLRFFIDIYCKGSGFENPNLKSHIANPKSKFKTANDKSKSEVRISKLPFKTGSGI